MQYIHEHQEWPTFTWDNGHLAPQLASVRHEQGRLIGRMESLGFSLRAEAVLQALTEETVKSTEIEGESLNRAQVRSSFARHLGVDIGGLVPSDRSIDGVVELMLDATQNYRAPLTDERLFNWHTRLFQSGYSGMYKIQVGGWRDDSNGPMQVVSGAIGKQKVHFQAPDAHRLKKEMRLFLTWVNHKTSIDPVLVAGIAHLWFLTIHPFEDGNGRIARAIAEMFLARSENTPQRFYSMSAQIQSERKHYYVILEKTQGGSLDITHWLEWYLGCLSRAFSASECILGTVLKKATFWKQHETGSFNDRQKKILTRLLDGFDGKLTSSKWAILGKCSQDTAFRDIDDLLQRKILMKNPGGGRSTSYSLCS